MLRTISYDAYGLLLYESKKDLSSHTLYKKIDMVVVRHFLKSIGLLEKLVSLKEDLFFIFIDYFA